MLGALFSPYLEVDEKIEILEKDYQIPMSGEIREEVKQMCNLSQGIKEIGREEGRAEERKKTEYEKNRANKAENRADEAENRANKAESQLSFLKEQLKRYQETYGVLT